jgi:polysaccharide pyruvyl transferase WcaK-like protein
VEILWNTFFSPIVLGESLLLYIRGRSSKIFVIIHGYFGFSNVGDEAILSVIVDEFKRMFGDVEFVVLSSNPKHTMRLHKVKAIRELLTSLGFWRFYLRSHVLVFAGGGRYGYATWRRMAFLALLARLLGKVVIFRAVGIYPYDWRGSPVISEKPMPFKGLTRLLIRLAVSRASYVSVRDKYSYFVLRLTGVSRRIIIENDLAFRLKLPGSSICKTLAVKYGITEGKVLGVSLRTLDYETNKKVINYVAMLIQDLMKKGFNKVVFIPFGFGSFKDRFFDNDLIIAKMLKEYIPNLIIVNEELSPKDVLCLFNYLDYVIAMRHHAIIFALIANKPMTALIYDTKTLELLRNLSKDDVKLILINDIK